MQSSVNIFWFRRDLRLEDNAGLCHALKSGLAVLPIFIFDKNILDELEDKTDARVNFIYQSLISIKAELENLGSTIIIRYGTPQDIFKELIQEYTVSTVYTNHDYEPYAIERDNVIKTFLQNNHIQFKTFKDQVIFEKDEVVKENGTHYLVFTPYARKWLSLVSKDQFSPFKSAELFNGFLKTDPVRSCTLKAIGFIKNNNLPKNARIDKEIIGSYDRNRNIPSLTGTSGLGMHLRFGTISIRKLASIAFNLNKTYLNELIWREFFMQLLWSQPQLVNRSCKIEYDNIQWRNNEDEFDKWSNGNTGFPIVDAGIRELNQTGFMHNRVRMITASFLVKHLLIDWRWGEAYFAKKLLDYELASNNGNWQWVAGCGCDAAPYFRIFNPAIQTKKFDPDLKYITRWVPELNSFNYPQPMVDHEVARERCLMAYKKALQTKVFG
ncbi:MAG TPA: deoxyribodipyrimidine photo-lyase, partial [Flavisolibacter sp.]|nr:deoxyribodipyrimidine photo-lyase [Flavisolibacter sp.]